MQRQLLDSSFKQHLDFLNQATGPQIQDYLNSYRETDAFRELEEKTCKTDDEIILYALITEDINCFGSEDIKKLDEAIKTAYTQGKIDTTTLKNFFLQMLAIEFSKKGFQSSPLGNHLLKLLKERKNDQYLNLSSATLYGLPSNFQNINLKRVNLASVRFPHQCDFSGALFNNACLNYCDLINRIFTEAFFEDADLSNINMFLNSFPKANFNKARLIDTPLILGCYYLDSLKISFDKTEFIRPGLIKKTENLKKTLNDFYVCAKEMVEKEDKTAFLTAVTKDLANKIGQSDLPTDKKIKLIENIINESIFNDEILSSAINTFASFFYKPISLTDNQEILLSLQERLTGPYPKTQLRF